MRKKLFVAGCSFSDYTQVNRVYGEILAQMLDYDYVHLAVGCGSNFKIWRKVTNEILNGNLTNKDVLVVQHTEITREEIWSRFQCPPTHYRSPYYIDDGMVTDWKLHSHKWQFIEETSNFHKLKEENFTSLKFSEELFKTNNHMFQTMLLYHKIPTIFTRLQRIVPVQCDPRNTCIPEYIPYIFDADNTEILNTKYNLESNDWAHISEEGHNLYAQLLFDHIKKLKENNIL